jgi:hypothetical protein
MLRRLPELPPEAPEVRWQRALPRRGPPPKRGSTDQYLLPAAERLCQLDAVVRFVLRGIGAEFEGASVFAIGSRLGGQGHADSTGRIETGPVAGKARWQEVPVRTLEPSVALARPPAAPGEVQQQKHVGQQLLRMRV